MFTKEDFLGYFGQIHEIEKKMREIYLGLNQSLQHPGYKELFGRLAEEEKVHEALIGKMMARFS